MPVWGRYLHPFPACLDCWKENPLAWPTSPFMLSLPSMFCFGAMSVAELPPHQAPWARTWLFSSYSRPQKRDGKPWSCWLETPGAGGVCVFVGHSWNQGKLCIRGIARTGILDSQAWRTVVGQQPVFMQTLLRGLCNQLATHTRKGAACALGYSMPDPTYPWGLGVRWLIRASLQAPIIPSTRAPFIPRKASLLDSSS